MLHGALRSSAVLAILALIGGSPAGAATSASPPAKGAAEGGIALPVNAPDPRTDRTDLGDGHSGVESPAAPAASTGGAPAQGDRGPVEPPPPKPVIAAVAVGGPAGTPSPLVITVVPAPSPPARVVSVLISGVPPGATLSHGENRGAGIWRVGLKNSDGLWSVGLEGLDIFTLTVPPDRAGTVELQLTAVAVHGERGIATSTKSLFVTFDEPPEPPPGPVVSAGPTDIGEVAAAPEPVEPETTGDPAADELPADDPRADDPPPAGESGGEAPPVAEAATSASPAPPSGVSPPSPEIDDPAGRGAQNKAEDEIADEPPVEAVAASPAAADTRAPADRSSERPADDRWLAPADAKKTSIEKAGLALSPVAPAPAPTQTLAAATPAAVTTAPLPAPSPDAPGTAERDGAAAARERLLMRRGDALFAQGDLAGARLFYESAAAAGSSRAAFALARTYDPLVHRSLGVRGLRPDPAAAADWYRKAIAGGSMEAEERLRDLTAWLDQSSR